MTEYLIERPRGPLAAKCLTCGKIVTDLIRHTQGHGGTEATIRAVTWVVNPPQTFQPGERVSYVPDPHPRRTTMTGTVIEPGRKPNTYVVHFDRHRHPNDWSRRIHADNLMHIDEDET